MKALPKKLIIALENVNVENIFTAGLMQSCAPSNEPVGVGVMKSLAPAMRASQLDCALLLNDTIGVDGRPIIWFSDAWKDYCGYVTDDPLLCEYIDEIVTKPVGDIRREQGAIMDATGVCQAALQIKSEISFIQSRSLEFSREVEIVSHAISLAQIALRNAITYWYRHPASMSPLSTGECEQLCCKVMGIPGSTTKSALFTRYYPIRGLDLCPKIYADGNYVNTLWVLSEKRFVVGRVAQTDKNFMDRPQYADLPDEVFNITVHSHRGILGNGNNLAIFEEASDATKALSALNNMYID